MVILRESRFSAFLERDIASRKLGLSLNALASLMILALCLPMANWLTVINAQPLYEALKLKAKVIEALHAAYNPFSLLSFVELTKQGALGIYASVLLLLAAVAVYFHLAALFSFVFRRYERKSTLLRLCSKSQAAMIFSFLAGLGTLGFAAFANARFGMAGFRAAFPAYAVTLVSALAYIASKAIEKRERALRREHGFLHELKKNWILFAFLIPCFLFFLINNYLPMAGIYFAFTQFNFRDHLFASPFVGLKNFEFLLKAELVRLMRNTVLYNLAFIGLGNIAQVFFAILISHVARKRLRKTSQTMIFMPYFVSYVILRVLVYNLFEYDMGLVNNLVVSLGGQRADFYNNPSYWPFFITLFYLWKNVGYGMVVYLATIMGISSEYYEAAEIDGANIFQRIRYITLPLLKPTFIILLLYALGSIMKGQFELFYQLVGHNGALYNATDIFDTYVYRITTTQPLSMGLGTAAGLFQSLFGFVIIMVTNALIKRKNPEYVLF